MYKLLNIILPACVGLLCHFGVTKKPRHFIYFTLYFFYVSFGEAIGWFLDLQHYKQALVHFYNGFFIPSLYVIQFGFFYYIIKKKMQRRIIVLIAFLYLASFIGEAQLLHLKDLEFRLVSYCIGTIGMVICSLLYLFNLVRSPAILHFKTEPLFWISAGLLFFQLFTFPFWALLDVWKFYKDVGNTYYTFSLICNYIAYIFYTIGILCWKKR